MQKFIQNHVIELHQNTLRRFANSAEALH